MEKKKLKLNAVPTIFEYFQKEKLHFYINNEKSNLDIIEQESVTEKLNLDIIEQELVNEENQIIINDKQIMHDKIKVKEKNNSEEIIKKLQFNLYRVNKRYKMISLRLRRLEEQMKNDKYRKVLKEIFKDDQINALLKRTQRTKYWSNETIKNALRFRLTCGTSGYEELL